MKVVHSLPSRDRWNASFLVIFSKYVVKIFSWLRIHQLVHLLLIGEGSAIRMRVSVLRGITFPDYWNCQRRHTFINLYNLTVWIGYLLQPRLMSKYWIIFGFPQQFVHISTLRFDYDMFRRSVHTGMSRHSFACFSSIFACWRWVDFNYRRDRTVSESATRSSGASYTRFTGCWRRVIVRKLDVVLEDCIKILCNGVMLWRRCFRIELVFRWHHRQQYRRRVRTSRNRWTLLDRGFRRGVEKERTKGVLYIMCLMGGR